MVVLFWLDLWSDFLFWPHQGLTLWDFLISCSCTLPLYHGNFWFSALRILGISLWCRGIDSGIVLKDLWEILFLATPGFELWTSGSPVQHSSTAPQPFLVFTSDNFRYFTLVQRNWWWYCSEGPVSDYLYGHTRVWTGDIWVSSPALFHCTTSISGFHLW